MDKQIIQDRIDRLKATIPYNERLELIKKNFIRIKKAHEWFKADTDRNQDDKALAKLETIYTELEKLGVEKEFSAALFIFGADITSQLVNQFEHE